MNKRVNKLVLVLLAAVFALFVTGCNYQDQAKVRTVELSKGSIDYQSFFNEFEDAELELDEQTNSVRFAGTQYISQSLMDEFDLVSLAENNDTIGIRYEFDYSADTNIFYLSAIADVTDGEIVDKWQGTPFIKETGETDICFATDDGILYLSELEESGALQNCGWLSKKLKRIAQVAAVVAVVAVVVAVVIVAAPAVTAAATTVGTAMAVGGGTAALTGGTAAAAIGAAAAAGAAAMATTAFAVAATTAGLATATAIISGVVSCIETRTYSTTEEKVDAARRELKRKRPDDTIIYRMGSDSYYNLTPRAVDTNGLSFFSDIYLGKCVLTTKELVEMTGTLTCKGSNHVLVYPISGDIGSWIATKENANENPHPYTVQLKSIVIKAY